MIIAEDNDDALAHYGIIRRSGRYPWGSGGTELSRSRGFLGYVADLRSQNMSETEIARGVGMTTTELRAANTIALNNKKAADISMAVRLKDKGMSNGAIGERMGGLNESSVRALLKAATSEKIDILKNTASALKEQVDTKGFIDVGSGVENHIGLSRVKLDTAIAMLKEHGYVLHKVQVEQGNSLNKTTIKVLAPPGTKYRDIVTDLSKIKPFQDFTEDSGRSFLGLHPPMSIDSKRIAVKYAEQGGSDLDGVIYVRPGVHDLNLGESRYAQVRIAVDGSHYLKGMAMYKDDLPKGVDLQFNTNKSSTGNKLEAMKEMKKRADGTIDSEDPFGSSISRQLVKRNADGKEEVTSAMNIVNEEGSWGRWSKTLSSQVLSKQSPALAKGQLDMTYDRKKAELDEIMSLTNPTVRKKLLESYADDADSSAVHLKAASLPRQASHVILPIESLKETEIYAPNYRNGETVALIRYPHGGTFEIPELKVNNRHPESKKLLGDAEDAVGINSKVAARLSGADFDGDSVLVIPNPAGRKNRLKTTPPLEGLKDFDPQRTYPAAEGMTFKGNKQQLMGDVSNLITDMTIRGAPPADLARAVRHSMVVIDAEKHNLNYKLSAEVNGIPQLKAKYQGGKNAGASTLISKAKSKVYIDKRKQIGIDKETGKKKFVDTPVSFVNKDGKTVDRKVPVKRLEITDDAHTLSSNTRIERVYADHSNRLKALANEARKQAVNTTGVPYSPSAAKAYSGEVARLNAALNVALKNRPRERQARILAKTTVSAKRAATPNMDKAELKKLNGKALAEARIRTGAKKTLIEISDREWQAIQAGAITNTKLRDILDNSDLDKIKALATPRTKLTMTSSKTNRARSMLASGYTQAEVADALGVSLTTLKTTLKG